MGSTIDVLLRPDHLEARVEEAGSCVVVESSFRDGYWESTVRRGGETFVARGPAELPAGAKAALTVVAGRRHAFRIDG